MKLSLIAATAITLACSTAATGQAQNPFTNFADAYNNSFNSAHAARMARNQDERDAIRLFNDLQNSQVQRQIMQQEIARLRSQAATAGAPALPMPQLPNLYNANAARAANAAQNARIENEMQNARSQALAEQMQRQLTSILAVTCARNGGMVINGKCI